MKAPLIVFDLETGGLDKAIHPIIQFAGVAVNREWEIVDELEVKIEFDLASAQQEALELNSYSEEEWERDAVTEAEAMKMIAAFFKRHDSLAKTSKKGRPYKIARLCGHNASRFDGEFLAAWFKRADMFCPAGCFEALDTVQLARWILFIRNSPVQPENVKLETLAKYLGIEAPNAHDAMGDVKVTVEVARIFSKVVDKRGQQ